MKNISPSDQGLPHKVSSCRGHFHQNHEKGMNIAKAVFFDKTVWGACQFLRGHQAAFRVICSTQEKICSTKQHGFHE